ncbi:MAG: DUF2169 domain-containing protein [Methylococcales bacterium]
MTFIIKGTFDLKPDRTATVSDEQLSPTGCELYEDDEEGAGSNRYDSDFAFFKPKTDLLLVGNCHIPDGKLATSCRVSFQVGKHKKSLAVIGNRYWRGILTNRTDPEPFTVMPIKYENSFGGCDYKINPLGKGVGKKHQEDGETTWALPNIEYLDKLIETPNNRPEPACFAPLGQMWQQRYSKIGSYKGNWLKDQWPWFPNDFDWEHYNAAPEDMLVKGYLKGDEDLFFENLHPVHGQYQAKLPGIKIRAFVYKTNKNVASGKEFKKINMNLDTLWVDMEAEKLVLVWRGVTEILSPDYEEIKSLFFTSEGLDEPRHSAKHYHKLFHKQLKKQDIDEELEEKTRLKVNSDDFNIEDELEKAEKEMKDALVDAGIDPENITEPSDEDKKEVARLLKKYGLEDNIPPALTREQVINGAKQKKSFAQQDLNNLDLSGIELRGADFQGANLTKTNFQDTDLSGTNLEEATLSLANLTNCNLSLANLTNADLTRATLIAANLTAGKLNGAIFEKTNMQKSILDHVDAENAIFSESNLSESLCREGRFLFSDFSKCNLDNVDFTSADLSEANVEGVSGKNINMSKANLTELRAGNGSDFSHGTFKQATGKESIWADANLTGADFTYCQMEGADFSATNLTTANLSAANMKFSRFTKANLSDAVFRQMNLFQGSLEESILTRTVFDGSNLYGVEFLNAVYKKTSIKSCNIKMTKLEK